MAFKKGNEFGKLTKRGKAKTSNELKEKLENLTLGILNDIDHEILSDSDKLKLLSITISYVLPKLKAVELTAIEDELSNTQPVTIEFIRDASNN